MIAGLQGYWRSASLRTKYMKINLALSVAAICAGLVVPGVGAQSTEPSFNALQTPQSDVACAKLPKAELPPNSGFASAFEFEDQGDSAYQRKIDAAFDSTGSPLMLMVMAMQLRENQPSIMHVLKFRFVLGGMSSGVQMVGPLTRGPSVDGRRGELVPPTSQENLPTGVVSRAHDLGVWLWTHRCQGAVARS